MKARLHVLGWNQDTPAQPGETPTALLHGVLELDGQIVQNAKVKFETEGGECAMLTAQLLVESFEVVRHDSESWSEVVQ